MKKVAGMLRSHRELMRSTRTWEVGFERPGNREAGRRALRRESLLGEAQWPPEEAPGGDGSDASPKGVPFPAGIDDVPARELQVAHASPESASRVGPGGRV